MEDLLKRVLEQARYVKDDKWSIISVHLFVVLQKIQWQINGSASSDATVTLRTDLQTLIEYGLVDKIVLDHTFAKDFFRNIKTQMQYEHPDNYYLDDDEPIFGEDVEHEGGVWQYHLQQLVLQKDKLKYLEKFLLPEWHKV